MLASLVGHNGEPGLAIRLDNMTELVGVGIFFGGMGVSEARGSLDDCKMV